MSEFPTSWIFGSGAGPAGVASTTRNRDGSRRIHPIGGNRAIPAQATEQLRSLSFLVRSDKSVLSGLAGLELERLVLSESRLVLVVQTVVLHLRQLAHDGVDAAGLVVDDVPGTVLDGVAGFACLGSQIVVDALDRLAGLAATVGQLGSKGVMSLPQRNIDVVKTLLRLVDKLANRIVHAVETRGDRTQNVALAALQIVQSKAFVDVSAGGPALAGRRVD